GREFIEIRMLLQKADPFTLSLKEAKVAPRTRSPRVILGHSYATLFEDADHIVPHDSILFEREERNDVRLGGNVSIPVFISTDCHIQADVILTHISLKWLDLEHPSAPSHIRRRKVISTHREVMIETSIPEIIC